MLYTWSRPVKFVFKIVITNGVGAIMAYDQITLGGRKKFS
ncbi:unnamed protein product, partial [marine sediment metagenome]